MIYLLLEHKFYYVSKGIITESKLTLESSKQASYYFIYKFGISSSYKSTGVRAIISGTSLKISRI